MGKVFLANSEVYIWAKDENEAKTGYSTWAKEYHHEDLVETLEEIGLDTKIYLFTDEHGEQVWHWSVADEARDVVETNVKEFFDEYCSGIESPFVISFTE